MSGAHTGTCPRPGFWGTLSLKELAPGVRPTSTGGHLGWETGPSDLWLSLTLVFLRLLSAYLRVGPSQDVMVMDDGIVLTITCVLSTYIKYSYF